MRITVWILLLGSCQAFFFRPDPPHRGQKDTRRGLAEILRKSIQGPDNCRELSESFGDVIRNANLIISATLVDFAAHYDVSLAGINEVITDMLFGFDIINDDDARERYTCDITRVNRLSELKRKLEDNQFVPNLYRLAYDAEMIAIELLTPIINDYYLSQYFAAWEAVGLMDLDNARVERLKDLFLPRPEPPFRERVPPVHTGTNRQKCQHVMHAYRLMVDNEDFDESHLQSAEQWTGINFRDNQQVEALFCAMIENVENGIPGLYAVANNSGVIDATFRTAYPLLQDYVRVGRTSMEETLRALSPSGARNNYQDPSPTYKRNQIRNDRNIAAGPGIQNVLVNMVSRVVRFLQALEQSTVLSLVNDL